MPRARHQLRRAAASVARFRASKALDVVGGHALRLTSAEIRQLVPRRGNHRRLPSAVASAASASQGWAAGAALLIDAAVEHGERLTPPDAAPPGVYGYFMAEVLARLTPAECHALLALSLLPGVTAAAAVEVTEFPARPISSSA